MLPQIVIVLFVLICILIIKIKEFIEINSDIILIVLCAITLAIWIILQCKSIYSKYKKVKLKNKRRILINIFNAILLKKTKEEIVYKRELRDNRCILIYIFNIILQKKTEIDKKISIENLQNRVKEYICKYLPFIIYGKYDENALIFSNYILSIIEHRFKKEEYIYTITMSIVKKYILECSVRKMNVKAIYNDFHIKEKLSSFGINKNAIKNTIELEDDLKYRNYFIFNKYYMSLCRCNITSNEEVVLYFSKLAKQIISNYEERLRNNHGSCEDNIDSIKFILLKLQESYLLFLRELSLFLKDIDIADPKLYLKYYTCSLVYKKDFVYTIDNVFDVAVNIRRKNLAMINFDRNIKNSIEYIEGQQKRIFEIFDKYRNNDCEEYFNFIFDFFPVPYPCLTNIAIDAKYDNGILCIDCLLPEYNDFPDIIELKGYLKTKGVVAYKKISDSKHIKLYDTFIYQFILAVLLYSNSADKLNRIRMVCVNIKNIFVNKANGKKSECYVASISATPSMIQDINFAEVDSKKCFQALKGISGSSFKEIIPVSPIISFQRDDKRFTNGYNVVTSLTNDTNLASMHWQDFENLIRDIFEKEFSNTGCEVKITQASRDGGVDAVIFDPDPIRGGKIIVQAKRYTNMVGVSAVRDLYGTILNEGANKGILVTTSHFGPDAYKFSKNKPILLMSGSNLLHLLEKHGYNAKIDINEAKKILKQRGLD